MMTNATSTERRPGVSFCIPNWNHRDFLPRSLRSARRALDALLAVGVFGEILVIDDASRDGSQRALLALAALDATQTIDVILVPHNKGLAAARNLALRASRYTHVCFLDADNEIIAETTPLFWRAITMTGAPVIYGNLIAHDGSKALKLLSNCYVHEQLYRANYIDAFAFYAADVLLALGGFDESMRSHEDWEMILHLIAEGQDVVFVPACLGYYYVVPLSMVQTETFKHERMRRIFSQRGPSRLTGRKRLMFHPDIGWL